jgi:hypothetical protein
MKIVDKMPGITLSHEIIKDQIRTDLDKHFQPYAQDVQQAIEKLIAALSTK